jgi:hypothetical protein
MWAEQNVVEKAMQTIFRQFPPRSKLADPVNGGYIVWAAFLLENPTLTMEALAWSDGFPCLPTIFAKFAVRALLDRRGIPKDRFVYLTTIHFFRDDSNKIIAVPSDKTALDRVDATVGKAFVVQCTVSDGRGSSQTATLWLEDGTLEVFNMWGDQVGHLQTIINFHVLPFLNKRWNPSGKPIRTLDYKFHPTLKPTNWWNLYFLFLRSAHSKPVNNFFFGPTVDVESLIAVRDKVVQACGRLICRCAELSNPIHYDGVFGPRAPALMLTPGTNQELSNMFLRCSLAKDVHWKVFLNVDPALALALSSTPADGSTQNWPSDTDPMYNPFKETTAIKMVFYKP